MPTRAATIARPATPHAGDAFSLPAPGQAPHGAAEVVAVQAALERGKRSARILERLCRVAAAGPLCLHPRDLPAGRRGVAAWSRFTELLHTALLRRQVRPRRLATCIHSHHVPLRRFNAVTDDAFGRGERFVFLDGLQMQSHRNERVARTTADNWAYLWHGRQAPLPVYGGLVKSACPLLADEVAITVAPGPGLLSPHRSAWLPVAVDISLLADGQGWVDENRLGLLLGDALTRADDLFDECTWAGRRQQIDARLNRRIAMQVTGLGDLVRKTGANPAELDCLQSILRIVGIVRQALDDTSAALANQRGEVPSLSRACPPMHWLAGDHGRAWRSRFDAARRAAAVRHRNLLALSPYSVLPREDHIDPGYIDLLPAIGLADAWTFSGAPRFAGWNVTQFQHFHRRARAVIQASHGAARIAAGV